MKYVWLVYLVEKDTDHRDPSSRRVR